MIKERLSAALRRVRVCRSLGWRIGSKTRFVCERDLGFRREKTRLLVVGRALRRKVEKRVGRIIFGGFTRLGYGYGFE